MVIIEQKNLSIDETTFKELKEENHSRNKSYFNSFAGICNVYSRLVCV